FHSFSRANAVWMSSKANCERRAPMPMPSTRRMRVLFLERRAPPSVGRLPPQDAFIRHRLSGDVLTPEIGSQNICPVIWTRGENFKNLELVVSEYFGSQKPVHSRWQEPNSFEPCADRPVNPPLREEIHPKTYRWDGTAWLLANRRRPYRF